MFSVTKFFIKDFDRGYSATGKNYLIFMIIAEIVLAFLAFGLPYLILKLYPKQYPNDSFSSIFVDVVKNIFSAD